MLLHRAESAEGASQILVGRQDHSEGTLNLHAKNIPLKRRVDYA
jgi:hypothetical protein